MISGEAKVLFKDPHDKEPVQVGMLKAGSIFGELTMLGVSPVRTATIKARTICTCWCITQAEGAPLLDEFPDEIAMFENIVVRNLEHSVLLSIQTLSLFHD